MLCNEWSINISGKFKPISVYAPNNSYKIYKSKSIQVKGEITVSIAHFSSVRQLREFNRDYNNTINQMCQ